MKKAILIIVTLIISLLIPALIYVGTVSMLEYWFKSTNGLQLYLLIAFLPTLIIYPLICLPVLNFVIFLMGEKNWKGIFKISHKFDDLFQILAIPWLLMGLFMPPLLIILLKIKAPTFVYLLGIGIFAGICYPVAMLIFRSLFEFYDSTGPYILFSKNKW